MATLKGTETILPYVQCFMYLVSSSINVSIFHSTRLDTFWTGLIGNGILFSHKNEYLPFVITCMEFESIMLSKIIQIKINYHVISLKCGILKNPNSWIREHIDSWQQWWVEVGNIGEISPEVQSSTYKINK